MMLLTITYQSSAKERCHLLPQIVKGLKNSRLVVKV